MFQLGTKHLQEAPKPAWSPEDAHRRLGQGEACSPQDVALAHAKLLLAVPADDHLHLVQRRVAALRAEDAAHILPQRRELTLSAIVSHFGLMKQ